MTIPVDDQCIIVLRLLPCHQYAIDEQDEKAQANEAEDETLRPLVVVPLVPLLMIYEHQVSNRKMYEDSTD